MVPGTLIAATAVGGAVGSVLRLLLTRLPLVNGSVLMVCAINVLGSLLLGLLWAVLSSRGGAPLAWNALGVGLLGGFTTYSTYSLDIFRMIEVGRWPAALAYALGTAVAAVAGCAVGVAWGRTI